MPESTGNIDPRTIERNGWTIHVRRDSDGWRATAAKNGVTEYSTTVPTETWGGAYLAICESLPKPKHRWVWVSLPKDDDDE